MVRQPDRRMGMGVFEEVEDVEEEVEEEVELLFGWSRLKCKEGP